MWISPPSTVPAVAYLENPLSRVEIQQRGVFAAALRHRELGEDRPPGRGLRGIARVDLIGQMRFRRGVVQRDAGLGQRRLQLPVLRLQPGVIIAAPVANVA